MIDNRKNPWYYLTAITLGVIVGGILGWLIGNHPVTGGAAGAGLAVVAFLIVGGPRKPTSAYSFAPLALFCLPSWHWLVLALVLLATLIAVAYMLYAVGRMCWRFSLRF